ncbi:MAG: D-alanyl-D-alanine carboxypeptidase family protein [Oscillospiraceae bacterium]|nr:D-alanyl-D-alanine carboxypeptidase family protein [Oscillospiraceae bacterium]
MTKLKQYSTWLPWAAVCIVTGICIALLYILSRPTGWVQEAEGRYYYDDWGKPVSGWQEIDSQTLYFREGGLLATGWTEIDGQSLYFRENGLLATGWTEIEGIRHCLDENGLPVSGWFADATGRYYLDGKGIPTVGWLELEGKTYYFNENGHPSAGRTVIENTTYVFDDGGALTSGWYEDDSGTYYVLENGTTATGWVELDDLRYYLDEDGRLYAGWLEAEGRTYYIRENGTMATGIVTIDGVKRFFDSRGQELLLVNRWNPMPTDYTAELADISNRHQIDVRAYEDFQEMFADCRAAGNNPIITSSFRTWATQEYLYNNKINYYLALGYSREGAITAAGTSVAIPGTSEHQLGLAVDISDTSYRDLGNGQWGRPSQQWLMENSWKYGFILRYPNGKSEITGIIYEPWHYRYVGRELAAELYELDLCLEEYMEMLTVDIE